MDVEDVRILSMVRVREDLYFAQVKYGVRFKKGIDELEREISERLRGADIYRNLSLFANVVILNDLVRKCTRAYMEKGRTCYVTENLELVKVRESWIVRFR